MVVACFVLDLCSLSPPLLRDIKQLKIAYSPGGNFCLRDFHHAVKNLPGDSFLPEMDDSGALRSGDAKLSSVLSDQVLYSWGEKDFMRKVIVLSSCWHEKIDSAMKNTLMSTMKLHQVSSPIEFNIIERTNLESLSEETMLVTALHCYYILQPSDNGPMLLRRLAGLEEVLPMPDINQFIHSSVSKDVNNSIQASLLKIELRDYNPVQHERGFHQKLNLLVNESLQFGSIPPKQNEATSDLISKQPDSSEVIVQSNCVIDTVVIEDESPQLNLTAREDKSTSSIAEEWEQLVVCEVPNIYSSPCISKPKTDILVLSSPESNKQLDVKTSTILERLEVPRMLKTKVTSPIVTGSSLSKTCLPTKRPLIPFQQPPHTTDQSLTSSQLMKPNFQRLKRKIK
ncbi:hypothetical protein GH714_040430 [Hevea brasiliensis]|uniref:Uncharacterized protein n=1 Tax=Hevea brasiliensis TaxID=3981 RepID=A0A6A6N9X4_HEVBR|nr:hypothetical protein GH714_040430 [Hevea brasiliensis]